MRGSVIISVFAGCLLVTLVFVHASAFAWPLWTLACTDGDAHCDADQQSNGICTIDFCPTPCGCNEEGCRPPMLCPNSDRALLRLLVPRKRRKPGTRSFTWDHRLYLARCQRRAPRMSP